MCDKNEKFPADLPSRGDREVTFHEFVLGLCCLGMHLRGNVWMSHTDRGGTECWGSMQVWQQNQGKNWYSEKTRALKLGRPGVAFTPSLPRCPSPALSLTSNLLSASLPAGILFLYAFIFFLFFFARIKWRNVFSLIRRWENKMSSYKELGPE